MDDQEVDAKVAAADAAADMEADGDEEYKASDESGEDRTEAADESYGGGSSAKRKSKGGKGSSRRKSRDKEDGEAAANPKPVRSRQLTVWLVPWQLMLPAAEGEPTSQATEEGRL